MEFALVLLGVLNLAMLAYIVMRKNTPLPADDAATLMLKADLTTLSENVTKLKDGLQQQLTDQLGRSQASVLKQFEASSKLISDVTEKLTELDRTNKQVGDVATELKTLQNVLLNPKQRGGVGEYYLQTVLENVLPPGIFELQYAFADNEKVDAVIFLDKKILPIDAKFSLENYNRLIEEKDKVRREELVKLFKTDIKNRIDETGKYIRPKEDTMDFAFMYIPSEAVYYDLLVNKIGEAKTSARNLIEYAYRDKKVIIVSPTTLLAYLQTVMQGLRSLKIEEQAKDIQKRVGELGRHIAAHETLMHKLGNSLGVSVTHFNNAHKELAKMDKDIVRIADGSPVVEPLLLDRPVAEED